MRIAYLLWLLIFQWAPVFLLNSTTTLGNLQKIKDITNQYIEENEVLMLQLMDYFSGQLIEYSFDCEEHSLETSKILEYAGLMRISPGVEMMRQFLINGEGPNDHTTPFRDSTLQIIEKTGNLAMYFLDRNFNFRKYDITLFSKGLIEEIYSYQLDTSLVNSNCQDLIQLSGHFDVFIMLCENIQYSECSVNCDEFDVTFPDGRFRKTAITTKQVLVQFKVFDDSLMPEVRYLTCEPAADQSPFKIDMQVGIKSLYTDQANKVFANIIILDKENQFQSFPSILSLNEALFDTMEPGDNLELQDPPFAMHCVFMRISEEKSSDQQNKVLGFTIIHENLYNFAFAIDRVGLLLLSSQFLSKPEDPYSRCFPDRHDTVVGIPNINSVSSNQLLPGFVYATTSFPAQVYEVNITDPLNPQIFKSYGIQLGMERYVGTTVMAVNENYIAHLIMDTINVKYLVRVYCKKANLNSVAKFQYDIQSGTSTNFLTFPNQQLDILMHRDEQYMNISLVQVQQLVLNASQPESYSSIKNNFINITLKAKNNESPAIIQKFQIMFLLKNDYSIYPSLVTGQDIDISVFYNCGEYDFQYILTYYYSGPNFDLTIAGDDEDSSMLSSFEIWNEHYSSVLNATGMDLTTCGLNFFLNQKLSTDKETEFSLLLCVEEYGSTVRSYALYDDGSDDHNYHLTHTIEIPSAQFYYAFFDETENLLLLISRIEDPWETGNLEFHFLCVDNDTLIWNSGSEVRIFDYEELKQASYNSEARMGCLVTEFSEEKQQQDIYIFSVDYDSLTVSSMLNEAMTVTSSTQILKMHISDAGLIFFLSKDNKLLIKEWLHLVNGSKLNELKDYLFEGDAIIGFDIIDNRYLLLFSGDSDIRVYNIANNVNLMYKMILPFYDQFQKLHFCNQFQAGVSCQNGDVIRNYNARIFAVLLYEEIDTLHYRQLVFLFGLDVSQHSTYIMVQDFSEIFVDNPITFLHLINNKDYVDTIAIMNVKMVKVFDLVYENFLALSSNSVARSRLLNNCSKIIIEPDEDGKLVDKAELIDILEVNPVSLFKEASAATYSHIFSRSSQEFPTQTISIYSQNQGQVITLSQEMPANLTYNTWKKSEHLKFLMEDAFQGFNISYEMECSFTDYATGNLRNCNEGLIDWTISTLPSFLIEFVTSQKEVFKSLAVKSFQLIFDTTNVLNVFYTEDYYADVESYDGWPLVQVSSIAEEDLFGCSLNQFIKVQLIFESEAKDSEDGKFHSCYMILYTCKVDGRNDFKITLLEVIKGEDEQEFKETIEEDYVEIIYKEYLLGFRPYHGFIYQGYDVFDACVITTDNLEQVKEVYKAKLIVTYLNEGSYSNQLQIHDLRVNVQTNTIESTLVKNWNAQYLELDTFLVTKITIVPDPSCMVIVIERNTGAFFIDVDKLEILYHLQVFPYDHFQQQNQLIQGDIQVFSAIGNWPSSLHIVTNYGIFIFDYDVSLPDRSQWEGEDYSTVFEPSNYRIIRQYLDQFNYEIVSNQWGYAFLLLKQVTLEKYSIYLGAVSFYSNLNSKLFKMEHIVDNQDCYSINIILRDFNNEDELPINFVCGTSFYAKELCMRPMLELDLAQFVGQATNQVDYDKSDTNLLLGGGQVDYNQFKLVVIGSSCQESEEEGGECSAEKATLYVSVSEDDHPLKIYLLLGVVFVGIAFISFLLILWKGMKKFEKNDENQDNNSLYSKGRTSQTTSTLGKSRDGSQKEPRRRLSKEKTVGLDLRKTKVEFFTYTLDQKDSLDTAEYKKKKINLKKEEKKDEKKERGKEVQKQKDKQVSFIS